MSQRRKQRADQPDVVGDLDRAGTRTIIGEFAMDASRASLLWTQAVAARRSDPDRAMTHLADLLVYLQNILPNQSTDLLRATNEALDALESQTEAGPRVE